MDGFFDNMIVGDSMKTKIIKLETLENVIPLIIKSDTQKECQKWVYVEFPYKHLLPVLEVA